MIDFNPQRRPVDGSWGPQGKVTGEASGPSGITSSAGALGKFRLPGLDSPEANFVKPLLQKAFGVNVDALAGQSPAAVLMDLLSRTRTQQAEGKRDVIQSAFGSRSLAMQGLESAAENYDVDIGAAVVKWATNPENFDQVFKFGKQVVETVAAAVASGGTSLIKDLPALGAAALGVVDGILKESGLSLQEVLGSAATDALIGLGMKPEDAKKLGPFLATAGIAGVQVANAVQTGDISGLDPKVFGDLAKNGAVLMGADQGTANTLGTLVGGGMSLADKFMNGNSELLNSGNLEKFLGSGEKIGRELERLLGGGSGDLSSILSEGANFGKLLQSVMGDLEKDTGIPGLQNAITDKAQQYVSDMFKELGPFAPFISLGLDMLQQGGKGQRSFI